MDKVKKQLMNWEEIFSTCRTKKRLAHRRKGIPVSQQKTGNLLAKKLDKNITGKSHKMKKKRLRNIWKDGQIHLWLDKYKILKKWDTVPFPLDCWKLES